MGKMMENFYLSIYFYQENFLFSHINFLFFLLFDSKGKSGNWAWSVINNSVTLLKLNFS